MDERKRRRRRRRMSGVGREGGSVEKEEEK